MITENYQDLQEKIADCISHLEIALHHLNKFIWNKISDIQPKEGEKVLAIFVSEKNVMYNCYACGWFRDTVYSCRIDKGRFIIQSHGPELPATHWMGVPDSPKDQK